MNKYGAKKTNGYASKREAERAFELKMLERDGKISDLQEQVRFNLIPKQEGEKPCDYIADFTYRRDGALFVEDVKGVRTEVYRLKRKLMLYVHGIRITEVA